MGKVKNGPKKTNQLKSYAGPSKDLGGREEKRKPRQPKITFPPRSSRGTALLKNKKGRMGGSSPGNPSGFLNEPGTLGTAEHPRNGKNRFQKETKGIGEKA